MRILQVVCVAAVCLYPVRGSPNNDPLCPDAQPDVGSTCSLPKGVGCQYKPFTCAEAPTVYRSLCSCNLQGTYVCIDSPPPTCNCPASEPFEIAGRCTLGTTCRYNPVGCVDGIKFSTNCECIPTANRVNKYNCTTEAINCQANAANCPADVPYTSTCDASKDSRCRYRPYGCPGGEPGSELFIIECECDALENRFVCMSASVEECNYVEPLSSTCFPGSAQVTTKLQQVSLDQLKIGDLVLVDENNRFEPVYAFGHRSSNRMALYLEIATNATTSSSRNKLRISSDHMIWSSGSFVPASVLRSGDLLMDGVSGKHVEITSIRNVSTKGAYAPFTPSGTIVVDGVVASSFVSLTGKQTVDFVVAPSTGSSTVDDNNRSIMGMCMQWMAHMSEFPHRVACYYAGSCPNEQYDEYGVSTWNSLPLRIGQWVLMEERSGLIRACILSIVVGFFCVFWLCENYFVMVTAMIAGTMIMMNRNKTKTG